MKFIAKLELRKKNDAAKIEWGYAIHDKMNGNVYFPNPDPSLAAFKTAIDEYKQAYEDALDGGKKFKAILKVKRKVFIDLINALRDYVNSIARGRGDIITSAGMDINKPRQHKDMTVVEGLQGKMGSHTGEIDFTWNAVNGCLIYLGYIKAGEDDDEQYKIKIKTSKSFATVGGLVPGKLYFLVMEAVGSDSVGPLSLPIQARAAF
jgi:hypothetical protein